MLRATPATDNEPRAPQGQIRMRQTKPPIRTATVMERPAPRSPVASLRTAVSPRKRNAQLPNEPILKLRWNYSASGNPRENRRSPRDRCIPGRRGSRRAATVITREPRGSPGRPLSPGFPLRCHGPAQPCYVPRRLTADRSLPQNRGLVRPSHGDERITHTIERTGPRGIRTHSGDPGHGLNAP